MATKRVASSGLSGVQVRGDGVRIRVPFGGDWVYESVACPATPKGLIEAARIRQEIIERSRLGLVDWQTFFPDSDRGAGEFVAIPTFAEMSAEYLVNCESVEQKAPSTVRGYRKRLDGLWVPRLGNRGINRIKRKDVRDIIAEHEWTNGKTFANALTPLKGVFALAIEDEHIAKNPAEGIKAPKWRSPPPDPLTLEERDRALDALSPAWLPYFLVAFGAGLRSSELMALKWAKADARPGLLVIDEARILGEDKGTKTGETRTVPLMPMAARGLELQRSVTGSRSPYVFEHPTKRIPLHDEQGAWREWSAALERAGVRHRKAYATRHTFATLLLMAGEPIERISKWLGHATPAMTYRHYATWLEDADARPSDAALSVLG